jgi:2-polyprenyl-3-methyl-5-hydroxy-6-metoxy-1,4-benzoquinol methylase
MQSTKSTVPLERVCCGVCGSGAATYQFDAQDYIYGNDGSFPVSRCDSCGVVFMNPRIPPAEIGPFYPKSYYTNQAHRIDTAEWKTQAMALLLRKEYGYPVTIPIGLSGRLAALLAGPVWIHLAWFRHNIANVPGGSVLDVGCGNGTMLTIYRRLGWSTSGTEVSPDSAAIARQSGHDVFLGELTEAKYPSGNFDAVTLWDALEHIHNPAETMAEAFRVCRPGGHVYVYVPNFGSEYARRYRDKWYMFTAPLHYYHYSSETLGRLLRQVGFETVDFKYPLGGVGIHPTLSAATDGLLNKLLRSGPLSMLLRFADRLMPRGHLLAVARKPGPVAL